MPSRRIFIAVLAALVASLGCATLEAGRQLQAGNLALDQGDTGLAIEHLEAAVRVMPEASELYNNLGVAYAADGRHGAALAAFERAVALDCDNQPAQQNLANARAVARRHTILDGAGSIP